MGNCIDWGQLPTYFKYSYSEGKTKLFPKDLRKVRQVREAYLISDLRKGSDSVVGARYLRLAYYIPE